MSKLILRAAALFFILLLLNGCSAYKWWSTNKPIEAVPSASPQQIYQAGQVAVDAGEYKVAIKNFEALEATYPFSEYSEKAHRSLIYAYFQSGDNLSTAAAADRYIRLYPRSEYVDYAFYMKGMANYTQDRGFLAKVLPMDVALRDPGTQMEAYKNFLVLVQQFPQSKYAADAKQRMIHLRELFARRELFVADFYLKRNMYVAAANRASYLIQNYSQSPSTEAALIILIQANQALGLNRSADEAMEVLRINYPSSVFLATPVVVKPVAKIVKR